MPLALLRCVTALYRKGMWLASFVLAGRYESGRLPWYAVLLMDDETLFKTELTNVRYLLAALQVCANLKAMISHFPAHLRDILWATAT